MTALTFLRNHRVAAALGVLVAVTAVFLALSIINGGSGTASAANDGPELAPNVSGASPAENGKIVFTSNRDGWWDIYTMDSDGTDVIRLTDDGLYVERPVWSPDGTAIAYFAADVFAGEHSDIYVMNADGSGQANLTNSPAVSESYPTWSPDGTRIAFRRGLPGDIHVMNADGSAESFIASNVRNAAWSPDGAKFTFTRDGHVWTMNADGSGQANLTTGSAGGEFPGWSPDSSKIVFGRLEGGTSEVYVMNADGTAKTNVTNNATFDDLPNFSPTGTQIVFVRNPNIHVMDIDGSNLLQLTNNGFLDLFPHWQRVGGLATATPGVWPTSTPASTSTPTPAITPTPTPKDPDGDTDGDSIPNSSDPNDDNDACTDVQENGPDETLGGHRDPHNPHDFYDTNGDAIVDLTNDIFEVIQHYAPTGTEPEYDVDFDRGPSAGPNAWNMTAPDGVIDLSNDILGVIQQYLHSCQ